MKENFPSSKEQLNLQEMQQKEYDFCIQNEQSILSTINEIMCFYNFDIDNKTN